MFNLVTFSPICLILNIYAIKGGGKKKIGKKNTGKDDKRECKKGSGTKE